METQTKKFDWFKMRGVEYSTDFNFFLEYQIFVSKSGRKYSFCSRLKSLGFLTHTDVFGKFESPALGIPDKEQSEKRRRSEEQFIQDTCKEIHIKLLSGGYGEGEFLN